MVGVRNAGHEEQTGLPLGGIGGGADRAKDFSPYGCTRGNLALSLGQVTDDDLRRWCYGLTRIFIPASAMRPSPRRMMVEGSGTGDATGSMGFSSIIGGQLSGVIGGGLSGGVWLLRG